MTNSTIRHLAAALLAALQFGCGGLMDPNGFELRGNPTPRHEAAVQHAIDVWCTAADVCAAVTIDGPSTVEFVPEIERYIDGQQWNRKDGSSRILLRESLDDADLAIAILHELGHHWGCPESQDDSSVMRWMSNPTVTWPSEADIACAHNKRVP